MVDPKHQEDIDSTRMSTVADSNVAGINVVDINVIDSNVINNNNADTQKSSLQTDEPKDSQSTDKQLISNQMINNTSDSSSLSNSNAPMQTSVFKDRTRTDKDRASSANAKNLRCKAAFSNPNGDAMLKDTTLLNSNLHNLPKLSHHLVDEAQRNLMRAVSYLTEEERLDVLDACRYGDKAHIEDFRRSGEPYITHPIAVAEILAGFHLDRDTIIAAILHDTVEDTEVSHDNLAHRYGATVANLVDGVTKLKSSNRNKKQNKAATFHKIISATLDDPRVLIIKLADRLHNMSTLGAVSRDKQRSTAKETISFYVPFARLMGLNDIADYIEILCYRNLDPDMYNNLTDKLLQHGLGRKFHKDAIQQYLSQVLDSHNISGNVRALENQVIIYRKFFRNRSDIDNLLRYYNFEVVTRTIEDCDLLADYLIDKYSIPDAFVEDNIRHPLPGGNQSLTLTYMRDNDTIKVTILTRKMQAAARLGVIGVEHASEVSRSVIKASLRNMKELIDLGKDENGNDPDYDGLVSTIDELTSYLNARKIVCYSPQGRAYELPRGAIALDFAYAVGPKIGNVAVGAVINDKPAKLGSILKDGQTVEIETDKDAKPKAEWLGIVVTGKASSLLRRWFSNLPPEEQEYHGKQALDRALRTYDKSLNDITQADWDDLLKWQDIPHRSELFKRISAGTLLPQIVVSRLFTDDVTKNHALANKKGFDRPNQLISNANGVEVRFAGCCSPIYGDPVIGHLSVNGLTLHRHRCYSVIHKRAEKPYELVQLNWHSEKDIRENIQNMSDLPHFTAFLKIKLALNDEQVSHVLYTLRELNIGVENVDVRSNYTLIYVIVRSRDHVEQAIGALRPQVGFGSIRRLYRV